MGRHHLGGEPGAAFHLGQFALGLFERGDRGGKLAVRAGEFLGIGQNPLGEFLGPCAQQFLLPPNRGDVGIDRDPAALRQGRTLDRDGPAVGAGAFHVVRLEGARGLDPVADEAVDLAHLAILAVLGEKAHRVLEGRTGSDEPVRQAEHLAEGAVRGCEAEVAVVDRQRLLDEVQPGLDQGLVLALGRHARPPGLSVASGRGGGKPGGRLLQFARISTQSGKVDAQADAAPDFPCSRVGNRPERPGNEPVQGGRSLAETLSPAGDLISIPALLARNAGTWGARTAYREKEFGIWQSWTWAEAEAEIRALALGFLALGMAKGDYVAIIGRNRPQLYWSMVAAQAAGAIPVPLYQDAVAEEMAYVLDHCGARFVVCGDQEQVDKVLEIQDRVSHIDQILYVDKRGMRKYDHSRLNWIIDVQSRGARGAPAA
jgi:hypothetical protein